MRSKSWFFVFSLLVLLATGCREANPYKCPDGSKCLIAGGPCSSSEDCANSTPVCREDTMVCVECTDDTHCKGNKICEQNICAECRNDGDCDSGLCLADKTCAGVDAVAYVDAAAVATNPCTKDAPCTTLDTALNLPTMPKYIKAMGMLATDKVITIDRTVAIYGELGKTKISRTNDGEVMIIKGMGSPQIALFDLEIAGNNGMFMKDCVKITEKASVAMTRVDVHDHGQVGITMDMSAKLVASELKVHHHKLEGIKAAAGTTLELTKSQIYNNLGIAGLNSTNAAMVKLESSVFTANTGTLGGVSITGPFTIRNSIFANNGDISNSPQAGGLNLNPLAAANAQFEFNTIADNSSVTNVNINCSVVQFDISNSIIAGNPAANCNLKFSLVTGTASGTNKMGDPMFVTKTFGDPAFYHIPRTSPAKDSADPDATLNVDIDGQARDDTRKDMGADEFK